MASEAFSHEWYKEWYQERCCAVPRSAELLTRWLALLDNEHFGRHMKMLRELEKGFDPLPDRDSIKAFLQAVGHDYAVLDTLAESSFLRDLFWGNYICQSSYIGLQGTVMALLMRRRALLTFEEIEVVYSTIDRILRGGEDWPTVTSVPAANRDFYVALKRIKVPNKASIITPLEGVLRKPGTDKFGTPFKQLMYMGGSAHHLITVAHAYRNGRQQATLEDSVSAGFAFARLFEIDIRQLPPVIRVGRTGYESVG